MFDNILSVNSASPVVLKLYVSGDGPRSQGAIRRLRELCSLHQECQVEIVDVNEQPARAEQERILATPTLVRESPPPVRRIVGDLTDTTTLLMLLDLREPIEETL